VISRAWRALVVAVAVVLVLLIGLSRIALGVHYLSDVVGA
jgi:undecaprenyl-diphosphatase